MSVFVDLDVPADELRQTLYDGNLVILTRLAMLVFSSAEAERSAKAI